MILAKKYNMNDLLSKIYLSYGKYYKDLGTFQSTNQVECLRGASKMYDKGLAIIVEQTKNTYVKEKIIEEQKVLKSYCELNNIKL